MKQINKVVILQDENITSVGRMLSVLVKKKLDAEKKETNIITVNVTENIADAVYQFDYIQLEIKPDLLIVSDFACIKMQSPEEEPLYNNMTIPVVHILFRRPWEYDVFMVWRTNFTDRFYVLIPEDVAYIKKYYRRLLNVKRLKECLFEQDVREVWAAQYKKEECEGLYSLMPDYMRTLAKNWQIIKMQNQELSDEQVMEKCLSEIGFSCSDEEYLNILYLMRSAILLYYKDEYKDITDDKIRINESVLNDIVEDFLRTDFPVSLL